MDEPILFSTPFFYVNTISDFKYDTISKINEITLVFENKKNKSIKLSFTEDDIRFAFKEKFPFISLQKLSTIPRDFKLVKYIFNAIITYDSVGAFHRNEVCTITKPSPISDLILQYNGFLVANSIKFESKIVLK